MLLWSTFAATAPSCGGGGSNQLCWNLLLKLPRPVIASNATPEDATESAHAKGHLMNKAGKRDGQESDHP